MIAAENKKSTSHLIASVLAGLLEDTLIVALEVRYVGVKEGVETPLLYVVQEVIVDILQHGKAALLLKMIIQAFTQSERNMDALMRQVSGCQTLIIQLTSHVKHHIYNSGEEHRLAQRLQQHYL